MGSGGSIPVKSHPDSYVVMSICMYSKLRIMNSTPEIRAVLERLNEEMRVKCGREEQEPITEYYGTLKMKPGPDEMYEEGGGKKEATLGKFFAMRVMQEMYMIGYDLVLSSDLVRDIDKASWFFAKSILDEKRSSAKICCIATGGSSSDKLILLHHNENIKKAVHQAIQEAWPKGVDNTNEIHIAGETLYEIKLHGIWGAVQEDGINTRKLICSLVGRMGELHWRLLTPTNLKGTADSYFFIYDPSFSSKPDDYCMISMSKTDRLRLINCNQLAGQLKEAVTEAGQMIDKEKDYFGCYEIKMDGEPWCSSGAEAIRARRTISRLLETMSRNCWSPYTGIDVSRSLTDKTSFLFKRTPFPTNAKYACIALSDVDRLRLLDFPPEVTVLLRNAIYDNYTLGVACEKKLPHDNLEVDLGGEPEPWVGLEESKGYSGYHARSLLGRMMKIAQNKGWYPVISADVSAKYIYRKDKSDLPMDVHTIYFVKMN